MKIVTDFSVTGRRGPIGAAFTPRMLFRNGELGAWFDFRLPIARFTDLEGASLAVLPGVTIARADDRSANAFSAVQPTIAARPTFARTPECGRRNLLIRTEELNDPAWTKQGIIVANMGSEGWMLSEDASQGQHRLFNMLGVNMPNSTRSVDVKAAGRNRVALRNNNLSGPVFELTGSGSLISGTGTIQPLADGWYRITAVTASAQTNERLILNLVDASNSTVYQGDGTSGVEVRFPQLELGLTATAYQRVRSSFDVTELGKPSRWSLFNDQIDDVLEVSLPDLGTQATLAFANENGVTKLYGQTIPAGPLSILQGVHTYGLLVIERPLTSTETEHLIQYMEGLRP